MKGFRRHWRVAQHAARLSFLLLVLSMTDFNGLVTCQAVTQVEAAKPQELSVDKNAQYSKRLQTALDQRPLLERRWRTYRAYPYVDRAARLARSHNIDGALAEYAKYLAHDPEHLVMRWQQLLTLSQTDKLEETIASATALLQRVPDFGPALLIRGLTLRKLERTEEAEHDFLAAQKDPGLVREDRVFLLSELYALALNREDYATALAFLEAQQAFHPDPVEWYSARAVLLDRQGRLQEAQQMWGRVITLATDPEQQQRATLSRARILSKLEQYETAFDLLAQAQHRGLFAPSQTTEPQLDAYYRLTAEVAQKAGRIEAAIQAWEHLMALAPSLETRFKLANLWFTQGDAEKAFQLLQPLQQTPLPKSPEQADAWYDTLGNIAFQSGHLRTAYEAYQKALTIQDTLDTRLKAAEVAWQLERYAAVVDLLQPVATRASGSRQPSSLAWQLRLCSAYAKQAQYPQAVTCAEALAEAYPEHVEVLLHLGNVAFEAGSLDTAFKAYQNALARQDTVDTRLKAAEAAWQLERYAAVVDLLQPVVTQTLARPSADTWQQRLCYAYAKQAQYPSALTCIASLVKAHPNDPDLLVEAAHFASQARQPQRQLDYLRRLYRLTPKPELALDIGYLLTRLQLDAEAGDWFRRAYRKDQSAIGGLAYAQFLLKYQERDTAIEVLRDIIEHPDGLSRAEQSTAYAALGYALIDTQDFSGAADVWRQAYDMSADPLLKLRQIWALRKADQTEQVQAELDAFADATLPEGKEAAWYEEVGTIWYELGAFERSLAARQKALASEPTAARWAQLSDTFMALSRPAEADAALEKALGLSPDTPAYLRRRGYVQIALHRDRHAAALFEQVRAAGESDLALDGELGYLYTRLADDDGAITAFKRAIDDAPHDVSDAPGMRRDVQVQMASMRSDLQAIERRWSLTLMNNTCLVDSGCRIDNTATDNGSAGEAFGSVEVAYQPPKIGFRNGKIFQLFSRSFWPYQPDAWSLDVDEDALQVGLGARYKPFSRHNLWMSLEHLFKIGDATNNNWLARLSWSRSRGAGWYSPRDGASAASVPYLTLYADVAKFFQHDQELVLTGTTRLGWTFQHGEQWQFSPFAYGVARGLIDDDPITAHVEAGLGLSLRFRFRFDHYWGYRHSLEVFSQVGHDLHNSGSDLELRALVGVSLHL
jgi:tetratricopeptide (TPR) repeat protein